MSYISDIMPLNDADFDFKPIESKYIVESIKHAGEFENETRITFEGFITPEMYKTLQDAIIKVVSK